MIRIPSRLLPSLVAVSCSLTGATMISPSAQAQSITVQSTTMQTYQGFGTSLAGGQGYYFSDTTYNSPSLITQIYDDLFTNLDLRFLRFELLPNFRPTSSASYDINAAIGTGNSRQQQILQKARNRNGNLSVVYSVWSPPAWMKYNNSTVGAYFFDDPNQQTSNKLANYQLDPFGDYLAEFCKQFKAQTGVPVSYLSPQNEPNLQTTYNSCVYSAAEYGYMLQSVSSSFRNKYGNTETKIMGPEYGYAGYNSGVEYTDYVQQNAGQWLDLNCIHSYQTQPSSSASLGLLTASTRNAKPLFMTEFYSSAGSSNDDPIQSALIGSSFCGDTNEGNASAWFFWAGIGSVNNDNPKECSLLANSNYLTGAVATSVSRTKRYYALQELTQTVKAGAVARYTAVSSDLYSTAGDVKAAAFKNTSGFFTIVIANKTANTYNNVSLNIQELSSSGTTNFTVHNTDVNTNNATSSYSLNNGSGSINLSPYSVVCLQQVSAGGTNKDFITGFESGSDPQPTWNDAPDLDFWVSGNNPIGVSGYLSNPTPECSVRTNEQHHTGNSALMYSGSANGGITNYLYCKVFDLSSNPVSIMSNSTISYWIYPQQDNGRYAGIDFHCTDGSTLRDSGITDSNGFSLHAKTGHGGNIALNSWTQISAGIGSLAGKKIDRVWVAYDRPGSTGQYRGYIDAINIDPPTVALPGIPTGVTAVASNAQVKVSWVAPSGTVSSYKLYRSTTSGGEGTTAYKTGLTGSSYTDTGLTNGTTYY